jgi:hypothetical protein
LIVRWNTCVGRTWIGEYPATAAELRLHVARVTNQQFQGYIEYDGGDVLTEVQGSIEPNPSDATSRVVRFRETQVLRQGRRSVSLEGEYRSFTSGTNLIGNWCSGDDHEVHFS